MRHWLRLAGLALLASPAPLLAQTPIPIPGTRPAVVGSTFGATVAASGNRLAVTDVVQKRVYIYTYEVGAWRVTASLTIDGGGLAGPRTGALVLNGTRLVVGTPGADESRGAALVFDYDGTTWRQTARLTPTERIAGAQFGVSAALSAGRIVVGQTPLFSNRGEQDAAFVFARDPASGQWTQETRLLSDIPTNADDRQADAVCFGWTVATQGDEIAVGAHCGTGVTATPRGRVYRFLHGPSGWTRGASIETPVGGATLGGVAFAGDDLIVSSSRGWHVYRTGAGGRTLATVLADTLQSDNTAYNRTLVGADSVFAGMGYNPVGRRDIIARFVRRGETWEAVAGGTFRPVITRSGSSQVAVTAQQTILGDVPRTHVLARDGRGAVTDTIRSTDAATVFANGTQAGASLDLNGGRLIVGLPGSDPTSPPVYGDRRGGAVVFSSTLAATSLQGSPGSRNYGSRVRLGDGFIVLGSAFQYTVYGPDASTWYNGILPTAQQPIAGLDARGSTLAAAKITAASATGEVELLRCTAARLCTPETVLTRAPTPGYTGEVFGASLGLDRTGMSLVVGAPVFTGSASSTQAPRVSLYTRDEPGGWRPEATISMPDAFLPGNGFIGSFGRGVARTRDTVVVTSLNTLYVFERAQGQSLFRSTSSLSVPTNFAPALAIGTGVIAYGVPLVVPERVLVFRGSATGTGWELSRTIESPSPGFTSFGSSLAIEGTRLIVGAPGAAGGAGEVYAYDLGTGVAAEGEETASALSLRVPNPVRGTATVRYVLDRPARVRLSVYDVLGRLVSTLVDGDRADGAHEIAFAAGLAPGAYIVRLDADGIARTRTVVVLR